MENIKISNNTLEYNNGNYKITKHKNKYYKI